MHCISRNHCPGGMRKTMKTVPEKHETSVAISLLINFISKSRALSTCVSEFRLGDQSSVPPKALQLNRETQDRTAFRRSYSIKPMTNLTQSQTHRKAKIKRSWRSTLPASHGFVQMSPINALTTHIPKIIFGYSEYPEWSLTWFYSTRPGKSWYSIL
jgi:hypothetical protein